MDILGIAIILVVAVYITVWIHEIRKRWKQEDAEDAAFERRRAERQAQIDRQNQAIARRVLIEQCETIYIGRWQND